MTDHERLCSEAMGFDDVHIAYGCMGTSYVKYGGRTVTSGKEFRPLKDDAQVEFKWRHIGSVDELECFYRGILTKLTKTAERHGYALAAHGSFKRDLDLIAVPWVSVRSDRETLAGALHTAACGIPRSEYQWERKPLGRMATMFPICWIDFDHAYDGAGHIDLSVVVPCDSSAQAHVNAGDGNDAVSQAGSKPASDGFTLPEEPTYIEEMWWVGDSGYLDEGVAQMVYANRLRKVAQEAIARADEAWKILNDYKGSFTAQRERAEATEAQVAALKDDAKIVQKMLELGDTRLMAQDGPCGGQLPDLSPGEWGKVYRACKRIAARSGKEVTK